MQEAEQKFIEYTQEYITSLSTEMDGRAFEKMICHVANMLGFDRYSLLSGCVFGGQVIKGWKDERPHRVINFDREFIREYSLNRLDKHDIVLRHGMQSWQPFAWSHLYGKKGISKQQVKLRDLSADFGMKEGVLFPVQGFGDDISLFSFSTGQEAYRCHMSLVVQGLLMMLMNKLHFSIKSQHLRSHNTEEKTLSPREIDVLSWLRKGKTYWEIGQILGISEHTVETYMRRIKVKLNVASKEQAIAKAVTIRTVTPL